LLEKVLAEGRQHKSHDGRVLTVTMSQKVTLKLRLLREWLVWSVAALAATIITPTLGSFNSV
jgi:hypothetical protein